MLVQCLSSGTTSHWEGSQLAAETSSVRTRQGPAKTKSMVSPRHFWARIPLTQVMPGSSASTVDGAEQIAPARLGVPPPVSEQLELPQHCDRATLCSQQERGASSSARAMSMGGCTPWARAHASFSARVMQQHDFQQCSAEEQPQPWFWQGKGLDRSFARGGEGQGTPTVRANTAKAQQPTIALRPATRRYRDFFRWRMDQKKLVAARSSSTNRLVVHAGSVNRSETL